MQITCEVLREELREELERFANETLSNHLTELGKRMRQGIQEDVHAIFASPPPSPLLSVSLPPLWRDGFPPTHHMANIPPAGASNVLPNVAGAPVSGPSAEPRARHSITSCMSDLSIQDPDELGWISKVRRGYRLTKSINPKGQKKRRMLKEKQEPPTSGIDSDRQLPYQNGCHDEASIACDGDVDSPPPERSASDPTPIGAFDIAPLPPTVDPPMIGIDPTIDAVDYVLPVKDDKGATGSESVCIFRNPKTFKARQEIGRILHGVNGGPTKQGPHDIERNLDGRESTASRTIEQVLEDATKSKRMSHGGLRALLKAEETTGLGANIAELSTGLAPVLQQLGQVSNSANHERDGTAGVAQDEPVSPISPKSVQAKSCCRRFLKVVACCPLFPLLTTPLVDMVESHQFDYISALLIALNAICIGVETDYMARNLVEELPMYFVSIDWCFCVWFSVELGLRLYVYRFNFFRMAGYRWNIFDTILVVMQVLEEVMEVAAISTTKGGASEYMTSNLSIMRILRILRLVRIIRLVRVMHLVSELRTIVVAIFGTLQSLMWTMALLLLVMYLLSVYLTQMVTAVLLEEPEEHVIDDLSTYYANMSLCILSLFQAITNGVDWKNMLDPLTEHVSPLMALVFCSYIGFSLFALMNIVTGVFVESALQTAKTDKDLFLLHHMTHLFKKTDVDDSGEISWREFEMQLDTPDMQEYFKAVDLDTEEARDLFRLIDVDSSGQIDAEEFVHGCLRLRGPAKAIDLATFMHDYRRTTRRWHRHSQSVEDRLSQILSCLPELALASSQAMRSMLSNLNNGNAHLPPVPTPRKKGLSL